MVFRAGKEYTGYVFARAPTAVALTVALRDVTVRSAAPKVLATTTLHVAGGSQWAQYNFSLTPTASTGCVEIPFYSDPAISCSNGLAAARHWATRGAAGWDVRGGHVCGRAKFAFRDHVPSQAACQSWCAGEPACVEFAWKNSVDPNSSHWCALFNASAATRPIANKDYDCGCRASCPSTPGPAPPGPHGGWRPEAGDACQRCGGELALGLTRPGDVVNLDFAALHPGQWGRFAGLEVRQDGVALLQSMGVTSIRQGGSFADAAYYHWKNWRGKKWLRPSFGAFWGMSYESSWGPFEFVDMCNAAGIEPIVTTTAQATISGAPGATRNMGPDRNASVICCSPGDMAGASRAFKV